MRLFSSTLLAMALSLFCSGVAVSQSSQTAMPRSGHTKTEMVPSLFVMNAEGATLEGNVLTLTGVAPNSIVFADRPVRAAGHVSTRHLLEEWEPSNDSFAKDPPNATVSVLSKDAMSASDAVVVLKKPRVDGDRLSFDVEVLEGKLVNADGPAAIFIDIIGMPRTPFSYAGVARRTTRRAFWYGAAAPRPYYPPPHPYYRPY